MARERVRLANDPQVKDRSFNASTVARLVLGGSRATYRLRLPITPSLLFEGPPLPLSLSIYPGLGRVLQFLHNHTERPASQSCSPPSPQQGVESGSTVCSDSIGSSQILSLLLLLLRLGDKMLYFRDWTLLLCFFRAVPEPGSLDPF